MIHPLFGNNRIASFVWYTLNANRTMRAYRTSDHHKGPFVKNAYQLRHIHQKKPTLRLAWFFLAFLIVAGIAALASAARAQTPEPPFQQSISLNATPAFEGNFKYGEWLPVFVELENNGPDTQAVIQIPIQGSGGTIVYASPLELPAGARKRVTVYVLPNNFTRQLSVDLVSGDELLASQRVDVHPNPNINYLVGLIAPERGALSLIATTELPGMKRVKVMLDIPPAQLPEKFEGLRSFDLLVINQVDTSILTPEQSQAIATWVRRGGRLVIGGGSGALLNVAGLPASLFPAEIVSTTARESLSDLEQFVSPGDHPIRVSGPFVVAQIQSASGQTLAGNDQDPLVTEWIVDNGFVNFIALDPAVSPFDAWNGAVIFWNKLLSPGSAYPDYLPTDSSARQQFASNMPYVLSNLPVLDLPSASALALMLVIYIVLVGPVNYFVLRQSKKLHLAWITIPLITLFFSAASFTLGYAMHGADIFINKISVIQLESDGAAHFDSFVGVYSPAQTAYQIEVNGGGLLSPLTPYDQPWNSISPSANPVSGRVMTLKQGDPAVVQGLSIDQWSMQSFMVEGSIPDFGAVQGQIRLESDQIRGELSNLTTHSFEDAYVVFGGKFSRLGTMAPGSKTEFSLDLTDLASPNLGASFSYTMFEPQIAGAASTIEQRKLETRRSLIESILEGTPAYLSSIKGGPSTPVARQTLIFVGWLEDSPPEIRIQDVEPGQQATSVVLMPLNYQLPESGPISFPAGMIPGTLVSYPRDGGSCGMPGSTGVYANRGEALFEFRLPAQVLRSSGQAAGLILNNLKLAIYTDSGVFSLPQVDLYDWQLEAWKPLIGLNQGVNLIPLSPHSASDGASLVRQDGLIQVRLTIENGQSCYFLALGLEGEIP